MRGMLSDEFDMGIFAIGPSEPIADMIRRHSRYSRNGHPQRGGSRTRIGRIEGMGIDQPSQCSRRRAGIVASIGGLAGIGHFQVGLEATGPGATEMG